MKKSISIILSILWILFLMGCSKKEPVGDPPSVSFKANVLEINDQTYLVEPVEGSDELKSSDRIVVSMKNMNPSPEPKVGDVIEITYDGSIAESYPAQITEVYGIKVVEAVPEESEQWDLIPMVMINGEIYMDTGHKSTVEARCGMMDGEITSTVDGTEQPTQDNESNFGTGYGYQYGSREGTIEIYMNEKWWIFATEEVRQQIQFPSEGTVAFQDKTFNKSDLSAETLEWLENYNSLSKEEQLAISYIPPEFYELCGYPTAEDMIAEETISYNGKEYKKSELSNATLHWLELTEQERMLSSYMPPEFMIFEETWGIILAAENVTPTNAIIKCTQSGGEPTGELHTGSWYILENWTQENGWKEMPYVIDDEIGWTQEAWIIPMENTCEWEINWEWLYGKLPNGKYRIGKELTDFRATGDYDNAVYFVEFEIKEE